MSPRERRIKVLVAKTSLDGHWRGVAVVSTALRDAGMEVVYGGELTADQIAAAAIQENVDVVGLSIGGRIGTVERIMKTLHDRGLDKVLVVAGGVIPPEVIPELKELGISGVFPAGSQTDDIIRFIRENAGKSDRDGW